MIKRIGRRLVSLLLTFVTILTMLPAMTLPALAATSGPVTGLSDSDVGLSFTGDAENAWTAGDDQIIGYAQTTRSGWKNIRHQSTLTITNNKETTATLSFGYIIDKNNGEIKVAGQPASASNTITQELGPHSGISIFIYSSSEKYAEVQITITNLKLVADVTAAVTFLPAENGSYTVDGGKPVTEEYTNTQSATTPYRVVATPAKGYQFRDWYNVTTGKTLSKKSSYALNVEKDCEITARFVPANAATFLVGSETFIALDEATEYAKANTINTITLIKDGTLLQGDYTIPSGITLLIPFDDKETLYTSKPGYVNTEETPTAYKTLTMASGSSITVNGAISVGGKHFAGSSGSCCKATGPYGQIIMQEGSSITLNNGAKLYAWGYITGDGEITAARGATVYEYFQVADWRGGAAVNKLITGKKVFPFSQYYVQNIEAALTIQEGAQEHAYFSVDAKIVGTKSVTIDFIGSNTSLFRIYDGGELTKKYDPKTDRITYTTKGSASLDSLALSVAGYDIDSQDYVLPVNSNMTLNVLSGKVAVNSDAALLPGAQITIAQGAELSVSTNKSLYVYDKEQWKGPYVYGSKESGFVPIPYSPSKPGTRTLADAKIDVNGTLTAAGSVYTTDSGADICSSEGTGRFVQQNAPGSSTLTHQVSEQTNPFPGIAYVSYDDIPFTPAQLKNADGKYTETAKASAGQTIPYCTCPTCGGKWLKDFAEIVKNDGTRTNYPTLQKAVTEFPQDSNGNTYIKMLHSTTEDISTENITTDKNLYLDLNGCTVKGNISVTGTHKLSGMDSSTGTDYVTAPTGKIVGTVKGYAPTYQTPGDTNDRYVAISVTENGTSNLSFHRFNISVSGYRFELKAPECALFFIGKFQGDKAAKDYLTELGFTLDGLYGSDPKKVVTCTMPAALGKEVVDEEGVYCFEAYLMRSFDKNDTAAYQTEISATAQAKFQNDGTQKSTPQYLSFEDAWKNAEISDPAQQKILDNFLQKLGITKQAE